MWIHNISSHCCDMNKLMVAMHSCCTDKHNRNSHREVRNPSPEQTLPWPLPLLTRLHVIQFCTLSEREEKQNAACSTQGVDVILMYSYKMPSICFASLLFSWELVTLWSFDCCRVLSLCFSQPYHNLKNLFPGWKLSTLSAEFLSLDSPTPYTYHMILNWSWCSHTLVQKLGRS